MIGHLRNALFKNKTAVNAELSRLKDRCDTLIAQAKGNAALEESLRAGYERKRRFLEEELVRATLVKAMLQGQLSVKEEGADKLKIVENVATKLLEGYDLSEEAQEVAKVSSGPGHRLQVIGRELRRGAGVGRCSISSGPGGQEGLLEVWFGERFKGSCGGNRFGDCAA
jgi:hypothetical protein